MNKPILMVLSVILGVTLAIEGHTMYVKNRHANFLRREYGATIHNPYIYQIEELSTMHSGSTALSGNLKRKMKKHNDNLGRN